MKKLLLISITILAWLLYGGAIYVVSRASGSVQGHGLYDMLMTITTSIALVATAALFLSKDD